MKSSRALCWISLVLLINLWPLVARADLEVSGSVKIHGGADFEAPLRAHGTWVEVGSYGRCWSPGHVAVGWRPYCQGEWVWTDCGWYWASDEPWGWACYHYGTWVYDSHLGWVWVPGVEWAPAWVSWRVGGGYIGWAPLPPRGVFFARNPHADAFVFVGASHFGGPVKTSTLISKNQDILEKSSAVGGLKRETRSVSGSSRAVMVNHGPGAELVQKATGRTLTTMPIQDAVRQTAAPSAKQNSAEAKPNRQSREVQPKPESGRESTHAESRSSRSSDASFGAGARENGRGGGGHGRGKH